MNDTERDGPLGTGGWVLVILAGVVSFLVLRYGLSFLLLSSIAFAIAIALIVLLLLGRLAAAIDRFDEDGSDGKVRRIVPGAAPASGGVAARAVADTGGVVRSGPPPSSVVTPLAELEAPPVVPKKPVAAPKPVAEPAAPPTSVPSATMPPAAKSTPVAAPAPLSLIDPVQVQEIPPAPKAVAAPKAKAAAKPKADAKAPTAKSGTAAKPKASAKGATPVEKNTGDAAPGKAATAAKSDKPAAKSAAAKPKAEKPATRSKAGAKAAEGPSRLTAPRRGKADDLKEIEGVGPAMEKLVNSLGFYHFDQIAAWTDADVALVDAEMKTFKGRIARDRWVAQARIIVTEGLEAFRERAKTNNY